MYRSRTVNFGLLKFTLKTLLTLFLKKAKNKQVSLDFPRMSLLLNLSSFGLLYPLCVDNAIKKEVYVF